MHQAAHAAAVEVEHQVGERASVIAAAPRLSKVGDPAPALTAALKIGERAPMIAVAADHRGRGELRSACGR